MEILVISGLCGADKSRQTALLKRKIFAQNSAMPRASHWNAVALQWEYTL